MCDCSFVDMSLSKFERELDGIGEYYLITSFSIKNYDGEIDKFLDWITPYIDDYFGQNKVYIGHTRYIDDDVPTLLYYDPDQRKIVQEAPEYKDPRFIDP